MSTEIGRIDKNLSKLRVAWLYEHLIIWDGGVRYIYEMSKRLAERCDLHLFVAKSSSDNKQLFKEAGVSVTELLSPTANSIFYWLSFPYQINGRYGKLKGILDTYDVIISSSFPMNYVATKFDKKSIYLFFEPSVFLYDNNYIKGLPAIQRVMARWGRYFFRKYDLEAATKASKMVTITEFSATLGQEIYGQDAYVIYPGVDTEFFRRRRDHQLEAQYSNSNVILHSASYFTPVKGTHFIIEALPEVLHKVPNCKLLILNCKKNEKAKSKLVNLAKKLKVLDNIEFLPYVEEEMLPCYYSLANVIVQPSIHESFRLSLQEGNACETPGVCFTGGSAEEDIVDGETGLIAPFGDINLLASSIVRILVDHEMAEKFGKAGRERVLHIFNWDNSVESLLKVVQGLT